MEIPFTQFLMPDGRTKTITIDRPDEVGHKANKLLSADCRLEIEMLPTGDISMTVERDNDDGEVDVLGHEICVNGPPIIDCVDKMIIEAAAALPPC